MGVKILIVDDESIIRNGISLSCQWERSGIEVVGQAENGKKALEMIIDNSPDIVITDVVMPEMDGIELVRHIRREYPEIRTIIISGYDEFEYAKEAISYGVSNYLLKPAVAEVILEEVIKLKMEIELDREQARNEELLRKKLKVSLSALREQFLNHIMLYGLRHKNDWQADFDYLEIDITCDNITVMVMDMDMSGSVLRAANPEDYYLTGLKMKDLCLNTVTAECKGCVFEDRKGRMVILLSFSEETAQMDKTKYIVGIAKRIQCDIREQLNIRVSIGIGRPKSLIQEIDQAYKEAVSALDYKFFMEDNSIVFVGDVETYSPHIFDYPEQIERDIILNIRTGNSQKACELVELFFDELKKGERQNPANIFDAGLLLLSSIYKAVLVDERKMNGIFENNPTNLLRDMRGNSFTTLEELKAYIHAIITNAAEMITSKKRLRNNSLIQNAKSYINQNIDKNVSLVFVADSVHLSPNYFSFLFKEECGQNFKDYIIQVRMEKALALITTTDLNLNQISDAVGYGDGRYFSQVFKRYFGKSPDEMRMADS